MPDHSVTAAGDRGPIPPDDPTRALAAGSPADPGAQRIFLAGNTYVVLLSGRDTQGRFCLIDMRVPDGGGPPPHRHDFEEMFTLLEGALEFTFRGETKTIAAPATINIPANAPHQFRNRSGKTVHMLCLCAPAGQEEFFAAVGVPLAGPDAAPPKLDEQAQAEKARLAKELAPKYRTEILERA